MFKLDWRKRLIAATPLICLLAYLAIGFMADIWDKSLLVFLLIPTMPTILGVKTIRITFSLIVVVIFLVLGFAFNLWHPAWLLFFLIPIYYILFGSVGIESQRNKKIRHHNDTVDADFDDK